MTPFCYARRAQFHETDLAAVVHFSWYLRYLEEAEHALWRLAGLQIAAPDSPLRFPRATLTIDYHAPLHFEDEFVVTLEIDAMSARSLRYRATIARGDTKIATATWITVCAERAADGTFRPVAIPDDVASRLRRYVAPAAAPDASALAP